MIDYTLGLASPLTQGKRVEAAQQRLDKGGYLRGPVDGVFGEGTGRACRRAKFALGYPTPELKATYGPFLDAYLSGEKRPTPEMRKRAKARALKAAQVPMREKALARAKQQVGVVESPRGSNMNPYGKWYGMNGVPWCAEFVTWCYVTGAKSKAFVMGSRYAYVPYIVADARAGRNGLSVTRDPKPGDVVCFDWDGGVADHVGLFQHWLPGAEGSEFLSIEGNTGVGNDSNGGEVLERHRAIGTVECFVRVGR